MTEHEWTAAADPARRVGRLVEFHPQLPSTNDRARAVLAGSSADGDGLAVVADLQTAGRGRRGRIWESPAGANLMVSVALRPQLPASRAGLLGIAAALAVRDASASMVPEDVLRVKWPNDVVTTDGRKLAGLLVETAIRGEDLAEAIIGMGINVNWPAADLPAELQGRATSLRDLAGAELDRVELLRRLLDALAAEVEALERGASPLERLAGVSALDGRRIVVDTGDGELEGTAAGVTAEGQLVLASVAGMATLAVGEVVAVRDLEHAGASR
ncbi:MAG TPA: biotin--[acetyl-CoA-carboxylase] ligase [Candidatus Limnocylindria bacterium]|jgi:BirA family biotin operon repressor/biotin-[acetyl-CoA-carboxylase] ligase